ASCAVPCHPSRPPAYPSPARASPAGPAAPRLPFDSSSPPRLSPFAPPSSGQFRHSAARQWASGNPALPRPSTDGKKQPAGNPILPAGGGLFQGVQELPAGLLAAPAGLLADPAVLLMRGMPFALVAAALTAGHAGFQLRPGNAGVIARLAADHPE